MSERHQQPSTQSSKEIGLAFGEMSRGLMLYTVAQLAALMHVSQAWIKRKIRGGELKAFSIGQQYRIPAWAVWEFHEERIENFQIHKLRIMRAKPTGITRKTSAEFRSRIKRHALRKLNPVT